MTAIADSSSSATSSSRRRSKPQPRPFRRVEHLVDAHTHLTSCGAWTAEEMQPLVQRAQQAGVEKICTVGDGIDECIAAAAAAETIPHLYAAVAIHPTRALELTDSVRQTLTELAHKEHVVAIGETGLDTYWIGKSDSCAPLEAQLDALRWHVDLAREVNKTLMIHNREADSELLAALAEMPAAKYTMLHCFSSPLDVAKEALERGYILSFTGNVTFKNNHELREAARIAPAGQLLIETDAPYMTPEPFRGRKNEPSLIGHTAACIAQVRGESVESLAAHVHETFCRIYGLRSDSTSPHSNT